MAVPRKSLASKSKRFCDITGLKITVTTELVTQNTDAIMALFYVFHPTRPSPNALPPTSIIMMMMTMMMMMMMTMMITMMMTTTTMMIIMMMMMIMIY